MKHQSIYYATLGLELELFESKVYNTRTNYETGKQVLEFQIKIDNKKIWVNADECIAVDDFLKLESEYFAESK